MTYASSNSNNNTNTKSDDAINSTTSDDSSRTAWVSRNNGKVYHYDKICSGLKNPSQMILEEV